MLDFYSYFMSVFHYNGPDRFFWQLVLTVCHGWQSVMADSIIDTVSTVNTVSTYSFIIVILLCLLFIVFNCQRGLSGLRGVLAWVFVLVKLLVCLLIIIKVEDLQVFVQSIQPALLLYYLQFNWGVL